METKSTAVKRELLTQLVTAYGNKPKNFVVQKAKEKGIYKYEEDDNEIYCLINAFASFHKLPFGYIEPKKTSTTDILFSMDSENDIEKPNKVEIDVFYESLIKQRDSLSKKLLALNRLIETYKKESEVSNG